MSRIKLKYGGKRKKAFLGADGAITAAATLASAVMTTAATMKSSKEQAKAIEANAQSNADALKLQNENNTKLQQEQMALTRTINQEQQDIQKDYQTTLQMMAGQQNLDNRMQNNRMQVKAGGSPSRFRLKSQLPYGGANMPFKVTDGGGVLPIDIDDNGYGLYELIGNDHEHYHKAPGGKNKTGVGIKFANGGIVEGEGNQGTNQGELLYVTPQDAMFISKHSIKGFNPVQAVNNGMHPKQAFAYQEGIKDAYGIKDDGTKAKCDKRKSIKKCGGRHKAIDGASSHYWIYPSNLGGLTAPNTTANVNVPNSIGGSYYGLKYANGSGNNSSGNTSRFGNFMNNYGGAMMNAVGNLLGAGISWIGNKYAANKVAAAQERARQYAIDAIDQMHGIDLNQLDFKDYDAESTLADIRSADTNINPQLERIRRNAVAEKRDINRGTLSSAARQTRNAEVNDRYFQRAGEQYAYKHNMDEQIKQQNAQTLTQVAQANADRKLQARQNYLNDKFKYFAYNTDVDNNKLQLKAEVNSDAWNSIANTLGGANQAGLQGLGNAVSNSASGFSSTFDGINNYNRNLDFVLAGADQENADWFIKYLTKKRKSLKI